MEKQTSKGRPTFKLSIFGLLVVQIGKPKGIGPFLHIHFLLWNLDIVTNLWKD